MLANLGSHEPDEQLKLGLRMVETAYEEKSRSMEQELLNLRSYAKERQAQISALESRVSSLEMQLQDSDQQKQQLVNEKSQMASELKSLSRDLSKLDQFKKSIMQSIHDEEPVPSLRYRGGASAAYDTSPPTNTYEPTPAAPRAYSPPQPSPPLPAAPAGGSSYKALSSAASSPPVAAAAPAEGGSAHLDGKDFFRQANLRLTKEQFRQFLSNIKRLNDHAQTREDTLLRAQEICGAENDDLFQSFRNLLAKHGLT